MKKTEELLRLAKATLDWDYECDDPYCTCTADMDSFHAAANPATIKQLVELCRLQHEALLTYECHPEREQEAIAAYERFEKGEG